MIDYAGQFSLDLVLKLLFALRYSEVGNQVNKLVILQRQRSEGLLSGVCRGLCRSKLASKGPKLHSASSNCPSACF